MFVELPLPSAVGSRPMSIQVMQIARYYPSRVGTGNWTGLVDVQGNVYDIALSYEEVKQKIEAALLACR